MVSLLAYLEDCKKYINHNDDFEKLIHATDALKELLK